MTFVIILAIAILIEAVMQAIKPLWGDASVGKLTVTEIVSIVLGVAIAVLAKLNIAEVLNIQQPAVLYVMYAFTGVAMGRGASFVHDLWSKVNTYSTKK